MEDHYRPPTEASSEDLEALLRRACPPGSRGQAFFTKMMDVAASRGLPYPQALRFVIARRIEATLKGHPVDMFPD